MKKIICAVLAAASLISCCTMGVFADSGSLSNFKKVRSYTDECFNDISGEEWYRGNVAAAYELGLMQGNEDGSFNPNGAVTIAETIVLACRLHSIYHNGTAEISGSERPWYMPYVSYALTNGLISGRYEDYNAAATRAEFAGILAAALPASALPAVNAVEDNEIPDVKMGDSYASEIYMLYRAGIVRGGNERGKFAPNDLIARREVAAIVTRMAYRSLREKFTLVGYTGPDLETQPQADDEFFSDAAILGNSLVEGLRLYSGLVTMDYYSGTSMSVNSACSTRNVMLNDGSYGTQLDAMAQKRYGKIYIELGINDIGGDMGVFIESYGDMLDRIIEDQPYADIYVMAITPVSKAKNDSSTVFTMSRVNAFNQALYELAAEKKCYYLDDCTPLMGSDGFLAEADTWDGVHLSVGKYAEWESVIRTHYVA